MADGEQAEPVRWQVGDTVALISGERVTFAKVGKVLPRDPLGPENLRVTFKPR